MTKTSSSSTWQPLDGFQHLAGRLSLSAQTEMMAEIVALVVNTPLYTPSMPRTGKPFSVRMTNCGALGWVSDKAGYRYQALHPETGRPWPPIPASLLALWRELAPTAPIPEACLINHYGADAKLGLHRDEDEIDRTAPVLSISLGDGATFVIGGLDRQSTKSRLVLHSGDVVVLGGAARLAYHGIDRIQAGTSTLVPWGGRINLTLRRVTEARSQKS
jgi:DNA oxidative demethylase